MAAKSFQRGWPIIYVGHQWVYEDTGEPIIIERPCRFCGQMPTSKGYDACIEYVPGAISVCCGHGIESLYVITSGVPPCSVILVSPSGTISIM